jgi:hypothetical protein
MISFNATSGGTAEMLQQMVNDELRPKYALFILLLQDNTYLIHLDRFQITEQF